MPDPDHRGGCSCGWHGPWRTNNTDAKTDAQDHCAETNDCVFDATRFTIPGDDLMPHERRKAKEGA